MTLRELLRTAASSLQPVTDCAALEAELLLALALSQSRAYILAHLEDVVTQQTQQAFAALLQRRLNKEPLAYISGKREFWSLTLQVTPDTLIPRADTECLIAMVLAWFPERNTNIRVADLGTGSGAIALALASERPHWEIIATDVSQNALCIASNNAQQLGLNHISFCAGNWCTVLPTGKLFDLIVSNPPYIAEWEWPAYAADLAFEPTSALVSGHDGLDAIRTIIDTARMYLRPNGCLFIEHGYAQGVSVRALFNAFGFTDIATQLDLAGCERVTAGRKKLAHNMA